MKQIYNERPNFRSKLPITSLPTLIRERFPTKTHPHSLSDTSREKNGTHTAIRNHLLYPQARVSFAHRTKSSNKKHSQYQADQNPCSNDKRPVLDLKQLEVPLELCNTRCVSNESNSWPLFLLMINTAVFANYFIPIFQVSGCKA